MYKFLKTEKCKSSQYIHKKLQQEKTEGNSKLF